MAMNAIKDEQLIRSYLNGKESSLNILSISKWLLHAEGTLIKFGFKTVISLADVTSQTDVEYSIPISLQ